LQIDCATGTSGRDHEFHRPKELQLFAPLDNQR
jgi:hypothetical protein